MPAKNNSKRLENGSVGYRKIHIVHTTRVYSRKQLKSSFFNDSSKVMESTLSKSDSDISWILEAIPKDKSKSSEIPARYKLLSEKDARKYSIWAVRFGVLASAINTKMLNPNFPIMAVEGFHPDSFPDTYPFSFNSATYFLPMASLLGVAISSTFLGGISDKYGRKNVFFILGFVSGIGSIVKYFTRHTFWSFCISSFIFGFFLGNLPISMAYIGDLFSDSKKEKEDELGVIVSFFVIGNSGGGIIAILMEENGLFAPLWVGAAVMAASSMITMKYMIEPGDTRLLPVNVVAEKDKDGESEPLFSQEEGVSAEEDGKVDVKDEDQRPKTIDQCALRNIIGGALADNFGSTGLFPLCLSPLALQQYLVNFYVEDEVPIMTLTEYKWLSVMVAVMVVPSTLMTPYVFRKIGVAGTCVLGNVFTAIITVILLFIAGYGPATKGYFAAFVTVLYVGFPFTVFSQLTTGVMLDAIAPEDKIGYVQGLNTSAMNFGMAIAPWLFGILADTAGTTNAIWTGVGVSLFAALVNAPLMRNPKFGRVVEEEQSSNILSDQKSMDADDDNAEKASEALLIEKASRGDFIPSRELFKLNWKRRLNGESLIIPSIQPYDKELLSVLEEESKVSFNFQKDLNDQILSKLYNERQQLSSGGSSSAETNKQVAKQYSDALNLLQSGDSDSANKATNDLGVWIGQYLQDSGYTPHIQTQLVKQMIISAFPPVINREGNKDLFTPDNVEDALLRRRQIMNEHLSALERKKNKNYNWGTIIGNGGSQRYYS